jgi:hypothetical protein
MLQSNRLFLVARGKLLVNQFRRFKLTRTLKRRRDSLRGDMQRSRAFSGCGWHRLLFGMLLSQ